MPTIIANLLQPACVLLDLDVNSKAALFEAAARQAGPVLGLDPKHIAEGLGKREKLGSTGLGQGVAIPHGRIKQLQHAAGVFVRTRSGIPYDAPDNVPVRLLFILLEPKNASDLHLQILAELAQLFSDPKQREHLLTAETPAQILQLLTGTHDANHGSTPV